MKIGAKTLASLTLLAVEIAAAIVYGALSVERLLALGWGTLFLVGCFGVVVGTLMFRLWRLGEPSRHYFRFTNEAASWELTERHFLGGEQRRIAVGENRDGAVELPPRAHHAVCVAIALVLALACIGARAVNRLARFSAGISVPGASYCPEAEVADTTPDPGAAGCELLRRAYALGYATSLGDCEVKKQRQLQSALCTRRQRDEPAFHYAWRLLDTFWVNLHSRTGAGFFHKALGDFRSRLALFGSLRTAQREVLTSAPHASHHIWTNLPDPDDGAFRERTCADRYRWLAHLPTPKAAPKATPKDGDKRASQVFEHVLAQLLFEGRYEPPAGSCREYHVHWGARPDVCQRLAANPEAVLDSVSALGQVRSVLDRYRSGQALALATPGARKSSLEPSAFLSFQCYIEGDGAARKTTPFSLAGYALTAEEVHVPPSAQGTALYVDRYEAVAQLLVKGFHYGRLLSEAGIDPGGAGLEASFAAHDYLLTRLYGLENLDIYLETGWIADRPDLLEVYPYQRHLKNYVENFRRQYLQQRGRL